MRAVVMIGAAIEVSSERPRGVPADPVTLCIRLSIVVLALGAWHWTQILIARNTTPRGLLFAAQGR
jgi:hypothetical protein